MKAGAELLPASVQFCAEHPECHLGGRGQALPQNPGAVSPASRAGHSCKDQLAGGGLWRTLSMTLSMTLSAPCPLLCFLRAGGLCPPVLSTSKGKAILGMMRGNRVLRHLEEQLLSSTCSSPFQGRCRKGGLDAIPHWPSKFPVWQVGLKCWGHSRDKAEQPDSWGWRVRSSVWTWLSIGSGCSAAS